MKSNYSYRDFFIFVWGLAILFLGFKIADLTGQIADHEKRISTSGRNHQDWFGDVFSEQNDHESRIQRLEAETDVFWTQDDALWDMHQNDWLKLNQRIIELEHTVFFPYVTQLGIEAPYVDDCGSAAILMVAKFYGIETGETVKEIHDLMIGSDLPSNYVQIKDFVEEHYTLNTKVIVTHPAIKEDLVEGGYTNGDDITVIDPSEFPNDVPVIWIYSRVPHWIVRYQNWAYDPLLGIRRFEATEDIYRPDYGLGIIVTLNKGGG